MQTRIKAGLVLGLAFAGLCSSAATSPRVLGCERAVRDFVVDGKVVTLPRGETRLDLAKLYPGEVKKGKDGTRVAEVVFSLSAPEDGEFEVKRFNDWFGEYFVNGKWQFGILVPRSTALVF